MLVLFAAAAAAAASAPAAEVSGIEVSARAPVVGTLQQGVQAYRSEFFTQVRPGTAWDMVQWLPGFTFEDTRDLRGLAGAAGNVLIDGQPPVSKNDTLQTVLRRIPASQVERVDIIVGGAPGIDMRGRSVLANVVLKKTGAPPGSVTASIEAYEDGRVAPELQASLSKRDGARSLEVSATVARRVLRDVAMGTGVLERRDALGRTAFVAHSRIAGAMNYGTASAAYQVPWASGSLRVNGSGIYQDVEADEQANVVGSPALYTIDIKDRFRQGELGLRYERKSGRRTVELQALQRLNRHSQDAETFRPPLVTRLDESDTLSESVARASLRFDRDAKLSLELSGEGAFNALDTESDIFRNGLRTPLPAEDVVVREWRGELGTLATWKPGPRFSLTGALKLEASRLTAAGDVSLARELAYLKPRAVLAWTPLERTQIRLRGEHEVQQIRFQNFVSGYEGGTGLVRAGNPNLRPRRQWVAEATVERQFWTGASVVLTGRWFALRDVVEQRPLAAFAGAVGVGNIGDGEMTEVSSTLTLPLKRLGLDGMNLKGTLTWRTSEVTDPTTGERRRLSGQSQLQGDLRFSHDIARWKLTWGVDATYLSPAAVYRPTTFESVGAQVRLSAFVEYRLRDDLNLRVEGFNLNDERTPWVIDTFEGLRGSSPFLFSEERRMALGPYLFVRLRKTLS